VTENFRKVSSLATENNSSNTTTTHSSVPHGALWCCHVVTVRNQGARVSGVSGGGGRVLHGGGSGGGECFTVRGEVSASRWGNGGGGCFTVGGRVLHGGAVFLGDGRTASRK